MKNKKWYDMVGYRGV